MKRFKWFLVPTLVAVFLLMGFYPLAAENVHDISVIQHMTHNPYTLCYEGFMETMKAMNYKDKINIAQHVNAEGDLNLLDRKVAELARRKDIDLIFSLGTQATKRVVDKVKKTPIVFTGLGDPEYAGIIDDWKSSGANYTGVETPRYVSLGIKLMAQLVDFKSIGMIYLQGAPSHEGAIQQVQELSNEMGWKFVNAGFPFRDEQRNRLPEETIRKNLKDALDKVLPEVDVFFVQISRTFENNFDIIREGFLEHKTISSGDPIYIKKGIIMGIGRDFKVFGGQCARYAIKILEGTPPAELPMDVGIKFTIEVNVKAASLVGYDPSVDVMGAADEIYQEIEK